MEILYIGRLFDKDGNSGKALWTDHAEKEFRKREKCFINEYGSYTIEGRHVIIDLYMINSF